MVNLKPTLLKIITTSILFIVFVFIFIKKYINKDFICKISCTYPNCPPCAYPTSTTEIVLWGILAVVIPVLFYLIYSVIQHKK